MNYIIFDLEFNQYSKCTGIENNNKNLKLPFEIIQIGVIKLNKDLQAVSSLNKLIRPQVYTNINPFVENITGISSDQLQRAENFKEVFEEFLKLLDNESILCVWGLSDIKELFRNINFHKLDTSLIPLDYINVQQLTSKYLNCSKGMNIGLSNATELLNIPVKDHFHDAYNDAYYTAEILKKIYTNDIKIKTYNYNINNRANHAKTKLDINRLFYQFEKMFSKELTSEEEAMIKLAYNMGKTNQFQIRTNNKIKDHS